MFPLIVTRDSALNMFYDDEDIRDEFYRWLAWQGIGPRMYWDWDEADLGRFFREKGCVTVR